ncbi:hypothetical protein NSE01_33630 [Novosphingobium sediminis]|uniref:Transposase n=1 Tax=Novosphingobium sediminis TaxID=707214 RepID=A0A512APB3_9SPHN|nr:hypothetical protein NSE01_33630 [Novosphingobium sediminis]
MTVPERAKTDEMKRKRFADEQIVGVLKEAEAGVKSANLAQRQATDDGQRRGNDLCNGIRHASSHGSNQN